MPLSWVEKSTGSTLVQLSFSFKCLSTVCFTTVTKAAQTLCLLKIILTFRVFCQTRSYCTQAFKKGLALHSYIVTSSSCYRNWIYPKSTRQNSDALSSFDRRVSLTNKKQKKAKHKQQTVKYVSWAEKIPPRPSDWGE